MSAPEVAIRTALSEDSDPLRPLLAPVATKDFLNKSFDKSALYIPGQTNKFEGLVAIDEFEDILGRGLPWKLRRPPELYLDGGRVPAEDLQLSYIDMDGHEAIRPRLGRVAALVKAGATVACYGMQVIVPSLDDLVNRISAIFEAEVEAHLIYSQAGRQGLAPHYDCADVFIVQLVGEKSWFVSSQRAAHPVAGLGDAEEFDPAALSKVYRLQQGDLLYLPRGLFHYAVASSPLSLHASLAAKLPTRLDYLYAIMNRAIQSTAMRSNFRAFESWPSPDETAVERVKNELLALTLDAETLSGFLSEVLLRSGELSVQETIEID